MASYIVRVSKQGSAHCPACHQLTRTPAELTETTCDSCGASLLLETQRTRPTFATCLQVAGRVALVVAMLASSTVFGLACEEPDIDPCDPAFELNCEEPGDEEDEEDEEVEEGLYRYVMVEDESLHNLMGAAPGADIDAIGVDRKSDGKVDHWATTVEDFHIGGLNNENTDITQLLGPPDSECIAQNFVALGGAGTNGDNYVIVGFSGETDITFRSGAAIVVRDLSPTTCPEQILWRDDETAVSVSISTDRASFTRIGIVGVGTSSVIIP